MRVREIMITGVSTICAGESITYAAQDMREADVPCLVVIQDDRVAGIISRNALPEGASSEEVWDRVMDVNLKGTYLVSWYAVPEMERSGGGSIINLASIVGLVGYPGRTRSEILAEFPHYNLPSGISETGWWNRGHEDPSSLTTRAIRVSEQLHEMAAKEERVALITHGGFMGALLKALFGQPPGGQILYRHHNTAISRIRIDAGERIEVRYLNRVDHLDPELVS